MVINNKFYNEINKISGITNNSLPKKTGPAGTDFESILNQKIKDEGGLKFSKHAELRLQSRNINLSDEQKNKIANAVNRASEKGVKDSLVLVDNLAFVVNVKNKTVITALNSKDMKDNVFTNIDGAVFA